MAETNLFEHGSAWVRADFHLHTRADKEFQYSGEDNSFISDYVQRLVDEEVGLGVITNHNKFDIGEFKALRKKAKKQGVGLLPGVELSVSDGANGVHTLVVFSDDWLQDGQDYINQFLNVAFAGKTPDQYEQENGRSNDDLLTTLRKLENYHKEFFVIFAHVEAASGLWQEIDGGRMQELAADPRIKKYCRGFQKVRTHDQPDKKSRTKVQQWWGPNYPAEVEGSDPKNVNEIGRGQAGFLKIGDYSFNAVKYALSDFDFRVCKDAAPSIEHSHIDAIRFEGGLFNGKKVTFSPHLNCLIGIQGSGKSAVLECLRYALDIQLGDKAQDKSYKNELIPHVLKSGGKVIVEATDRHGTRYEVSRILNQSPDVYVDGELQPGLSIRETIIKKPLYFGQKDLAAAGKGFGSGLVEKLVGDGLAPYRQKTAEHLSELEDAIDSLQSIQSDAEQLELSETELQDVKYRLEQFNRYGVKEKLDKQLEFSKDLEFRCVIEEIVKSWREELTQAIDHAEENIEGMEEYISKYNAMLFKKYSAEAKKLGETIAYAKSGAESISLIIAELGNLGSELDSFKEGFKDEFAEVERELVKALESQGVTSVQPNAYVDLTEKESKLESTITDLKKKTGKHVEKYDEVLKAITRLNDSWHKEFKFIASELDKINTAQSSLQIASIFKGDKCAFQAKMEDVFRGSNIRKESYQSIAETYPDFSEIYKDLEMASVHAKSKADTFEHLFVENSRQLLIYQVPNKYDVTYHGKSLRSHSLGQRASAMMLFLLSQSEDIDLLLIDQPEDDLDSQTIYKEVVKLLRDTKPRQQFIFATHNANFPVLGDAETVTACSAEDESFSIVTGSVDSKNCQKMIIDIMEGGPEAFERRKTIYQIWKAGAEL